MECRFCKNETEHTETFGIIEKQKYDLRSDTSQGLHYHITYTPITAIKVAVCKACMRRHYIAEIGTLFIITAILIGLSLLLFFLGGVSGGNSNTMGEILVIICIAVLCATAVALYQLGKAFFGYKTATAKVLGKEYDKANHINRRDDLFYTTTGEKKYARIVPVEKNGMLDRLAVDYVFVPEKRLYATREAATKKGSMSAARLSLKKDLSAL